MTDVLKGVNNESLDLATNMKTTPVSGKYHPGLVQTDIFDEATSVNTDDLKTDLTESLTEGLFNNENFHTFWGWREGQQ